LTANTAAANTSGIRQPAHKDSEFDHPQFPYYFIANIPLCDFSAQNGSTEFWLGSHAHTTAEDQIIATDEETMKPYKFGRLGGPLPPITEAAKEKRMMIRPPIQPTCFRGDIMIRDIRTWHAGMPNSSDAHRIMLGLGYQVSSSPSDQL
jgi:ectoine hydroxylase-related dioxygenase (phytanoyl-CoA dioxygenase family)